MESARSQALYRRLIETPYTSHKPPKTHRGHSSETVAT